MAADAFLESGDQQCGSFDPASLRGSTSKNKSAKKEKQAFEKIIGGQLVPDDTTWTWLVSLSQRCYGYDGPDCGGEFEPHDDGKGAGHICGSSVILDGQYLLTAAHCIDDDVGRAGTWPFENMEVLYGSNDLANAQSARIIATVLHPGFTANKLMNDIALIKLDQAISSVNQHTKSSNQIFILVYLNERLNYEPVEDNVSVHFIVSGFNKSCLHTTLKL